MAVIGRFTEQVQSLRSFLEGAGISSTWSASVGRALSVGLDALPVVIFIHDTDALLGEQLLAFVNLRGARSPLVIVASEQMQRMIGQFLRAAAVSPIMLRLNMPVGLIGHAVVAAHSASEVGGLGRRPPTQAMNSLKGAPTTEANARWFTDSCFDDMLPLPLYAAAHRFWTPVHVIERAAEWIDELQIRSVADIGCGVGKFCIVSAMFVHSCSFVGIEYRERLADVARELSVLLAVEDRVRIIEGRFGDIELPPAECYYLFNPFEENLYRDADRLDEDVELSPGHFRRDLRSFYRLVSSLPIGAYVMTYNGVGGRIPESLEQRRVERELPAPLRLFQKVRFADSLAGTIA